MNHEMKLFSEPFEMMKSGQKTIEIRINDVKRQLIKIGDTIIFHNLSEEPETLIVEVLDIICFNTFGELY